MCNTPSKCDHVIWIYAYCSNFKEIESKLSKNDLLKAGKWVIFLNKKYVDRVWGIVKRATESNKLGLLAKAGTTLEARIYSDRDTYVICVYTADYTNEKDVWRVRRELKRLGINKPIPYKRNVDTAAGRYWHNTESTISRYYG